LPVLISSPFHGRAGGLFAYDAGVVKRIDALPTMGLATNGTHLVRALALKDHLGAEILTYDAGGVIRYVRADELDDPHDIAMLDDTVLCVSSERNAVFEVRPGGTLRKCWQAEVAERDAWHVNCLSVHDGHVYASAFGRFTAHREWNGNALGTGFVFDVLSGETLVAGLSQPHHVRYADGTWLICNSGAGQLVRVDAQRGATTARVRLGGYPRGLAITETEILVGVSAPRADLTKTAQIVALDRATLEVRSRVALPCSEVYDLLVVDEALVHGAVTGFRGGTLRDTASAQYELFTAAGVEPARMWAVGAPLPREACKVTIEADLPATMIPGGMQVVTCRLRNRGGAILMYAPPNPVQLGYRWFDESDQVVDIGPEVRTSLPRPLPPGETTSALVRLVAPHAEGRYRLRISAVQELVAWFDDLDPANGLEREVLVAAQAPAAAER
jgi:acetolactate synthase-1/2/3 large subunit